jgi:hypothetical protein
MKSIALAVLLSFLPVVARAQDPSGPQKRSSGKKMEWVGLGGLLGGVGVAILAIASGKETVATYSTTTTTNSNCTVFETGSVSAVACTSSVSSVAATGGVTAPLTPPGSPGTSSVSSVATTVSTEQRRFTNWKIVGLAAGVAGAGALFMYLGHVRVKSAELSVRPNGAVQLAFKW